MASDQLKPQVIVWAVAGVGDNLLTVPLLLELAARTALKVVVLRESEREFFSQLLPESEIILTPGKGASLFKAYRRGLHCQYWVYPIGSSTKRFRLLNLLSLNHQAIGFTSLAGEKTWASEVGFRYTLLPDLGTRAWKNNLRLLSLIFPDELNRIHEWHGYTRTTRQRLAPQSLTARRGLAVHMGSNKYLGNLEKYKRWPVNRFFQLALKMQKESDFDRVSWIIGPGEEDSLAEISAFCKTHPGHEIVLCQERFQGSLVELYQFLAQVGYLIANDSGIAHLATLADTPMTVLCSGIGQVYYTGQNGDRTQLIWEDVACRACTVGIPASIAVQFRCPNQWACMENVTVDKAFTTIHDHLAKVGAAAHLGDFR